MQVHGDVQEAIVARVDEQLFHLGQHLSVVDRTEIDPVGREHEVDQDLHAGREAAVTRGDARGARVVA